MTKVYEWHDYRCEGLIRTAISRKLRTHNELEIDTDGSVLARRLEAIGPAYIALAHPRPDRTGNQYAAARHTLSHKAPAIQPARTSLAKCTPR